ncbi:MAG TPA: tetratricopeptide repeat protein [Phycisphaerae bacterium]|nr:tetratricopeptide repeat protein [Phycisphaerae bacterium]
MKSCMTRALRLSVLLTAAGVLGCQQTQTETNAPGALPARARGETPRLNATTIFAHAHLMERQGEFARAAVQYRGALQSVPDFVAARNRLGITLNKLGRHSEATQEFLIILDKNPNLAYVHNNLGFSYYLEGNYPAAHTAFSRALELRPDFPRARMNRGVALAKMGRFAEALEDFQSACTEADAYFNLAMIQSEATLYADAARSLELALRVNPKLEVARVQLREVARLAAQQEREMQQRAMQDAAFAAAATNAGASTAQATTMIIDDDSPTIGHAEPTLVIGGDGTGEIAPGDVAPTTSDAPPAGYATTTGAAPAPLGMPMPFLFPDYLAAFPSSENAPGINDPSRSTRVLGATATSGAADVGARNEFGLMGVEIVNLPDACIAELDLYGAIDEQGYPISPQHLSGAAASQFSVLMQRFVQALVDCPDEADARWADVQRFLADTAAAAEPREPKETPQPYPNP